MNTKVLLAVLAIPLVLGTTGCVSSKAGDVYSRDEARRVMTFREGTLVGVKKVKLEGTKSGIGTGAGAVVGGVAGSTMGQGKGAIVGAVVGAVAGGIVGAIGEEGLTREEALELTVKLDNGDNIIVVQGMGEDKFSSGERVRVVYSNGTTRVTH